jgi:putative FmdB family regulatory protein
LDLSEADMPIYAYRCNECGFQNDHLQKVSDPLLTRCPQCGKDSYKKMLTAAGFQLKGTGWYATDFKGGGAKPVAPVSASSKGEGEGKPAAKVEGDSKPDSKDASTPKTETTAAPAVTPGPA